MNRLIYSGKIYGAACELCKKSWVKKKDMYKITFPHPALSSLDLKQETKTICGLCAKREEKNLFKKIQENI
jgi:hypothetical protein